MEYNCCDICPDLLKASYQRLVSDKIPVVVLENISPVISTFGKAALSMPDCEVFLNPMEGVSCIPFSQKCG